MKNSLIILAAISGSFILSFFGHAAPPAESPGQTPPPQSWTLAEAVEYALTNNPEIHMALQRLESSTAMADSARSHTLPSVSLLAEYSQTSTPMYSFGNILNQGAFDSAIDFNDPGRTDDFLLQARIDYRLFDGGKRSAGVEQAKAESRASAGQLKVVHQQLAFEVVKTYHTIIQAKEMVGVREAAVEAAGASLAVGKAKFAAGNLLKQDLLNLELQQAREVENRIRSSHEYTLAQNIFWNLLGLGSSQQLNLPVHTQDQSLPPALDYSAREELRILDDSVRAAEAGLAAAQSDEKPAVDSFAQYQLEHGTVSGGSGDSWQAGVQLKYSLYNGNRTEAEIAAARARLGEAKARKARLELALSLELQKAEISYRQSLERLEVTAKMVEVAKESAKLSRIRFREGVILASDLIDTEVRLTDALAGHSAARADNRIAIANLLRATGIDQFTISHE